MADIELKQMKLLNSILLEKLGESQDKIEKLEEENQAFKKEHAKIKDELTKIKFENKKLVDEIGILKQNLKTSEKTPRGKNRSMSSYYKFKSPNEIHREITRKMRNREKVLPFQDDADDNFNESPNNLENHVKTDVKEAEKNVFKSLNEIKEEIAATHNKKRQREISSSSKIPAKCSKIESNNICHTCDISFTLYKDLIRHNVSVHEEKKLECPICSQKFSRSDTLKRHIKLLHGKITISIANL